MVLDMIKVSKLTLCQVLNAHMDSLQWIDSSALAVERKLGEVTRLEVTMISYLGDKATMSELLK